VNLPKCTHLQGEHACSTIAHYDTVTRTRYSTVRPRTGYLATLYLLIWS